MMSVRVDVSAVHRMIAEAEQSLLVTQPAMMKTTLDAAAEHERSSHDYQNRTGDLEAETQATDLEESPDAYSVTLLADTDYAEYVNRRGLMTIDDTATEAETELQYYFEAEADRIAGL